MEQALAKVTLQTTSSLAHQKTPALLLLAVESTLKEQKTEKSSTAYLATLLTLLESTLQNENLGLADGDILPAELYLLALVMPFVPAQVIRGSLDALLSLTAPLWTFLNQHSPALRSQLSIYRTMLQSLDHSQLEIGGIRQSFASILQLCKDPRPKIRKKATDIVKDVLSASPSPLVRHPYANDVAQWVISSLAEAALNPLLRSQPSEDFCDTPATGTAFHMLAFLRPLFPNLPPPSLPPIMNSVLTLSGLGNPYLSQSAYSILPDLLSSIVHDESTIVLDLMAEVFNTLLSSPPHKTDTNLLLAWIQALDNAMLSYSRTDPEAFAAELERAWKTVWAFLDSGDPSVRQAVAQSLDLMSRAFTPSLISFAVNDGGTKTALRRIVARTAKALDSLAYTRSIPELLSVVSSLVTGLKHRQVSPMSPTAAESLLLPLIKQVGELRTRKGFKYKEEANATLVTAIRILGPKVLLQALPLNLEFLDRQIDHQPRAFLLPLLCHAHPSPLEHFTSFFVPLSEQMFDRQQKAESDGKQSEAKAWGVLLAQVWMGLTGYCWATIDLQQSFDPTFSQLLSNLLYSQPGLRPAILKALKVMVDSNVALSLTTDDQVLDWPTFEHISPKAAANNVAFLRTQAESWLAVLFNVFGSVGRDGRGAVGDVISAWASIAPEQEIANIFAKVIGLLKTNLGLHQPAQSQIGSLDHQDTLSVTATMQDLLILLLPVLSFSDSATLLDLCLSSDVLCGKDSGIQKRGYKILTKLVQNSTVPVDVNAILCKLEESTGALSPAAKKDRFNLLSALIPLISSSEMHVIPSIIPEAILGVKEPSGKARTAAFDLILAMGHKMSEGGTLNTGKVDGMDKDAGDTSATIEEFMTMVAGGLAGATPHMISATVTTISLLVFEFKTAISTEMHADIFITLLAFLSSANREIVKSVLGFVKVAVHALPADLIRPHLTNLVRYILERILRRFGWDEVYSCAGKHEAAKVLVDIKKRKARVKRRKATGGDKCHNDQITSAGPAVGDAFEDVLYGNESELENDDDGWQALHSSDATKQQVPDRGTRLRIDDDEPIDLLCGAASHITIATSNRRRKPGQEATHFKTEHGTDKIIIDDPMHNAEAINAHATDVAGNAYRESIISVDGFTRGLNGQLKFNKNTRKRKRDNDDMEDVETDTGPKRTRKIKGRTGIKLSRGLITKKDRGDINDKGVDPYDYLSLSQAAKLRGHGGHGRIVGK